MRSPAPLIGALAAATSSTQQLATTRDFSMLREQQWRLRRTRIMIRQGMGAAVGGVPRLDRLLSLQQEMQRWSQRQLWPRTLSPLLELPPLPL